jgi:hypothetical protein
LEGQTSKKAASNGEILFEKLRYKSKGDYIITASSTNEDSVSFETFTVQEAKEVIVIKFNETVMIGNSYKLEIDILDQNNANWIDDVEVTITTDKTSSDAIITGGSYKGTASFTELGDTTLVVRDKNTGITNTTNVKVIPKSFVITAYGYTGNYDSSNLFNVMVQTDTQDYIDLTLTISCNKTDACSGIKMKERNHDTLVTELTKRVKGLYVFENFYIVSSGPFNFVATARGYPSATSKDVVTITNKFKRVNASFSELSTSGYTDVTLTTIILGEDDEPYLYPAEVNMTYNEKTSSDPVFKFETNRGIDKRNIYFTEINSKAVYQISTNLSDKPFESDPINIKPNKFELDYVEDDWLPTNTEQSFSFDLYVKDNKNSKTIKNHDVKITFKLEPSAEFDGKQDEVETSNGKVTIDDLIVSESGTYNLLITCSSCETYTSEEFKIDSTNCRLGGGPLGCMGVLIFFIIITTVIFFFADRNTETYQNFKISEFGYRFIHTHPFIAIFIRQPKNRRILVALELFTSELLTLTLIGAIYAYYDTPIERYERKFTDYYARQLYKGGTGWALAQAGIIPIFFLNFYSIGFQELRKYTATICIILVALSFGAIIGMTVKYCIGYSNYWTANFLIFVLFDIVLMQVIYTLVAICVIPLKVRDALNHEHRHSELTGELKDEQSGTKRKRQLESDDDQNEDSEN